MTNNFHLVRTIGTPNFAEFDNGLRIKRPGIEPNTGKMAVFIKGEGWNRFVMCSNYDNHFVSLNPYFANPKYPGMNSIMAFCSCGSQAVVTGYQRYASGFSIADGGNGFVKGELLVCKEFTDNLVEHGIGRHYDGSS